MIPLNSCGPDWLDRKLSAGEVVIVDGAMGTELQARGAPMHEEAWSGAALISHPKLVRAIHADYIRAGAEIIITNTFSSGRHRLEPAGLGDEASRVNRLAVELAIQARDEAANGPVAIAGSICEWDRLQDQSGYDWKGLRGSLQEQAELLAEAGVDLLALEMCQHPEASPIAVEAALSVGLPVWVGLSCKRDPQTGRLVSFDAYEPDFDFESLVDRLAAYDIGLINVMHCSIEDTAPCLAAVKRRWTGPLGAYPESGYFKAPHWEFTDIIEPDDLVDEVRTWIDDGVQLVGGCCGLGPRHVAALSEAFGS